MTKAFKKLLLRIFGLCLPKNRVCDTFFSSCMFLVSNRRLPSRKASLLNDRLFWLLVGDEIRDPVRKVLSDKARCKEFVSGRVGPSHVVPSLAVLDGDSEIDAYAFPDTCCIKSTHASGHVILRRNGEPIDRRVLKGWIREDYYARTREANYHGVAGRIIVEPIIFPEIDLLNYRFFCIDGRPRMVNVDGFVQGRVINAFLDLDWRELDLLEGRREARLSPARPRNFEEMLSIAAKIGSGFSFVRVDMYTDEAAILVGEVTNCHGGSRRRFVHRADEALISSVLFGAAAMPAARYGDAPVAHGEGLSAELAEPAIA